jgi:hypothetical protein
MSPHPAGSSQFPACAGSSQCPSLESEGDGAPIGAAVLLFHAPLRRRGAFRRAVRRFPCGAGPRFARGFVPSRLRLEARGRCGCRSLRASGGPSRPTVSELLAGGRSAPGRSPGAARVRGLRSRARGRRPDPHERRNRFASPQGVGRTGIWS